VIPTPHHWNGLDHHGYLTRTTADTALLTGIAPADAEPLRVAWSTKVPVGGLGKPDATVRGGLDAMIAALRGLGHTVTERDPELPFGGGIVARYLRGVADDAASLPHPERLDKRSRGLARLGRLIPEPLFQRALAAAETDRARFSRSFETADVVMMPVINSLPPRIGDYEGMGALASLNRAFAYTPYPGIFNHTGLPAVAVPAGTTPDGFPLGVQFIGPMGSEPRLLALAAQLEDELGWPARRPPGFETGA
jgi:amidase